MISSPGRTQIKLIAALWLSLQGGIACAPKPEPESVKGTFEDAQRLYDQGKPEEAEKILSSVKVKNPADAKTHFLLGRIYRENKNLDLALEELEGVVNLDPRNA